MSCKHRKPPLFDTDRTDKEIIELEIKQKEENEISNVIEWKTENKLQIKIAILGSCTVVWSLFCLVLPICISSHFFLLTVLINRFTNYIWHCYLSWNVFFVRSSFLLWYHQGACFFLFLCLTTSFFSLPCHHNLKNTP